MEKIKKNLPVILLSVIATLLLVIVIILLTNNNGFSFNNKSNNEDNKETNNTKEVKKDTKKEESKEDKTEESKAEERKEESKKEEPVVNTTVEEKSETNLLSYFEGQESLFTSSNNNESLTSKLKDGFTSVVDFIFYDKEIKGYTFKELTNSAKLKVISLALRLDNKIDSYFPNYKDKIKDKYNNFKGKLAYKYLEVTTSFCDKDPDTCSQAQEDFSNMKNSFGFTWDLLKELTKSGTGKIKDLYENWRDQ